MLLMNGWSIRRLQLSRIHGIGCAFAATTFSCGFVAVDLGLQAQGTDTSPGPTFFGVRIVNVDLATANTVQVRTLSCVGLCLRPGF